MEKDAFGYFRSTQNYMYQTGFLQQFNDFLEYNKKSNILNFSKELKKAYGQDFGEHYAELKKINKSENRSKIGRPDFRISLKQKSRTDETSNE